MADIRFAEIRDLSDLARVLATSPDALGELTQPAAKALRYQRISLPKKGKRRRGEVRVVYKVRQDLKLLQSSLATAIASAVAFDDHVQGFVNKRSIVTNARVHLGQKQLLHADIHHFFESITVEQVRGAFVSLGCVADVALALAEICTLDGRLPEGSSASPAVANVVARYLDADLKSLAQAHGCRYTRYADDITISGDVVPDGSRVEAILQQQSFALRDGKCRTQARGKSQYVTGLTVGDPRKPHVPRIVKRRIRLELHYAKKFGLLNHLERSRSSYTVGQELKRLGGWISFISSVEGKEATERFYQQWLSLRP